MKTSAIEYETCLNINDILSEPFETVNVFVPLKYYTSYNPVLTESLVFGPRPYSSQSDILAIIAHMGIFHRSKKAKNQTQDILSTFPDAIVFGFKNYFELDDVRKIESDIDIKGLIVVLYSAEPLDYYQPRKGVYLESRGNNVRGNFSVDIIDYHFVLECDDMPKLYPPSKVITKKNVHFDRETLLNRNQDMYTGEYQYEMFSKYTDAEFYKSFRINFHTLQNDIYCFRWEGEQLFIDKIGCHGNTILESTPINANEIQYNEKCISVGCIVINNIVRVTINEIE